MEFEDNNIFYSNGTSVYVRPQKMEYPNTIHQQIVSKVKDKLQRDRNGKVYITIETFANAGEVIEVGKARIQYKIIRQGGFKNGFQTYYIKRTDCEDISNVDYMSIKVDDKVYFMGRLTSGQLLDMYYDLNDINHNDQGNNEKPLCNVNDFGCCPGGRIIKQKLEECGFIFTTGAFILNTNNDRFKTTDSDC